MAVEWMCRVVGPAGGEDDPASVFVHARQKQEHEEEVGEVIDCEIGFKAIVCECLAVDMLYGGIQG